MTGKIVQFFRGALFENVGLKFVSLLCALGFFVFIRGAERAERRFDVGISHALPQESVGRILVKEPPAEISVTLVGPRTQLEALPRDLGTIVLDLSSGQESVIEVKPSMLPTLPSGIEVDQIFPSRIELRWDDVVAKQLPLQIGRTGEPGRGFSVRGSPKADPTTVEARGAQSVVGLMQVARTAPFDVTSLDGGYHTRTLFLDLPPQGVEFSAPSVQATIEIVREESVSSFKGLRVDVIGLPNAKTAPDRITVTVRGVPDMVASLEANQIAPYVTLPPETDTNRPGSARVKVRVEVPGVDVTIEPEEVTVKW